MTMLVSRPLSKATEPAMTMLAYHNDPAIKAHYLARLAEHREADELVQSNRYWEDGKGCAVGCTIHGSNHYDYECELGIPGMLAFLEDAIFEGLPIAEARLWPEQFLSAIEPGRDLSKVGWLFLHWLLTDKQINPGITHPLVKDAVNACAEVMLARSLGEVGAAESAARSAANAARSAVYAAEKSAADAASAAWAAAWSAARSSARSAVYAAERSAESAESAWQRMAAKLLELIAAA